MFFLLDSGGLVCWFSMLDRLKDAATALGADLTPEALAKRTGLSVQEIEAVLEFCRVPPKELLNLAVVVAALKVRLFWVVTGQAAPFVLGTMTNADKDALELASMLDSDALRRWFRVGKNLSKG